MSFSTTTVRAVAVPGLLLVLAFAIALSLLIGAKPLPVSVVVDAFSATCQSATARSCWTPGCREPWRDCWPAPRWAWQDR
ncbi:ferric enterobactin transport system permease FepD [Raoultella ornithinolytica]|nr:ferric enterobactin transport system permease FepD [Raoultella ornithinolytica]